MSALTRKGFPAQFDGVCTSCGHRILAGDHVFYAPGNESVSGLDCCGDKDDVDLTVHQRRDDGLTVDEDDPATTIARTMPRGKTAADACLRCFQIPASNGTCGCDA